MKSWTHPQLGSFDTPHGDDWQQDCDLEAFGVFANGVRRQTIQLPPTYSDETGDAGPPSDEVVALTSLVIKQLPDLLAQGVQALWHDLTGTGSQRSGMWWHGGLEHAFEHAAAVPTNEKDLYNVLEPCGLTVSSSEYKWTGPVARIRFDAVFEEEHGVSFLTDGTAIIGVGYAYDSRPFSLA